MDIELLWEKARERTEVIRGRAKGLATFKRTDVPYVFLSESMVNDGHTVIRKGKVLVEKPLILLPEDMPMFEGFDFEEDLKATNEAVQMFLFMRGVRFPSLKYNNIYKLEISEEPLSKLAEKYKKKFERSENVNTALIIGPDDCWQFSVILYVASLVGRCARADILNLMEKFSGKD
ncbi:MAG: hypothetical protein PHT95_01770 [Candidatus Omnitrophica bacterium]|nr:hypothetical protein [Candidatus Omnitrophota bacterium]MDD4012770.1 hypothetical protein [Candidatus Omnitrophota bacterium]